MDAEFARYASNIITNITDNEYQIIRYCNVLKSMCIFDRNEDIQSMLYLGMALPKRTIPAWMKAFCSSCLNTLRWRHSRVIVVFVS